ncbi:MAG: esterase/lipase family protein [Saprospiraceae bacterium]
MPNNKTTANYLQGISRLLTKAVLETTDIVEAMHRRVVHPPFLPSTPIQHLITEIAGFTYNNIRRGTQLVSGGMDKLLGQCANQLGEIKSTEKRETMRSVLNGVIGDYLAEQDNPLRISMEFRAQGKSIRLNSSGIQNAYPNLTNKVLLLIHGSSMSDLQWTQQEHNHGTLLAEEFGFTPVYLHYNSGQHVSTNGQKLADQLEQFINAYPIPLEEITILAHSMGGLVTRSAVHYAQQQQRSWTQRLKKMIFLGTPHHGAPLEQMGNYLDVILNNIPYVKPFARLAKIRSAGVTDLRYGNLLDEDWTGRDVFKLTGDQRQSVPLPATVDCYSVAAIVGESANSTATQLRGDNLVGLKSALGQHKDQAKDLGFKEEHQFIVYGHNHLDLLSSQAVYSKLRTWMED